MTITLPLSGRLKADTHATHAGLDEAIMAAAPFASLDRYGCFARMQWAFHRDIDALYDDARLNEWLPGLARRRRLALIAQDLHDIGAAPPPPPTTPLFAPDGAVDAPAALGWLYVAEGSNLGASVLRKIARGLGLSDTYGARHLAPDAQGPAAHWRAFTTSLDAVPLNPAEERRAIEGAGAAFRHVRGLADAAFG